MEVSSTEKCQRYWILLRVSVILPTPCSQDRVNSQTAERTVKEGCRVQVGRAPTSSFRKDEGYPALGAGSSVPIFNSQLILTTDASNLGVADILSPGKMV